MAFPQLILASGSTYRKQLLSRLGLAFLCDSPDVDETPLSDEAAKDLALRLSLAKAKALAHKYPNALIIGSDQTADCNGTLLGKPGTEAKAIDQLTLCSAKTVIFNTGLCLYDARNHEIQLDCVPYLVTFLPLSTARIKAYIKKEQPLDCAGSFKAEALGSALFASQAGTDPTALVGLPLIRLCAMLRKVGVEPLA